MRDLTKLAHPFPSKYVHTNPSGGGSYVAHHVVLQRLLHVLGPFSFELVETVRGDLPEVAPNPQGKSARAKNGSPPLTGVVVGVVARLTLEVDGRRVVVEEAGDCEDPRNWPHDGARMKDAMSDALKRCAMRVGVGLHLWAQSDYYLGDRLLSEDGSDEPSVDEAAGS